MVAARSMQSAYELQVADHSCVACMIGLLYYGPVPLPLQALPWHPKRLSNLNT